MPGFAGYPVTGAGGFVVVSYYFPSNTIPVGNTLTLTTADYMMIDNATYEFSSATPVDDTTTSYSGGQSEGLGGVSDSSITVMLPDDTPSSVDTGVLIAGMRCVVWAKRGNTSYFDVLIGATYAGQSTSNDNQTGAARRITLPFQKGKRVNGVLSSAVLTHKNYTFAGATCATYLASITPSRAL